MLSDAAQLESSIPDCYNTTPRGGMHAFKQCDQRWRCYPYAGHAGRSSCSATACAGVDGATEDVDNICASGCGITSSAMLLTYHGHADVTPPDVAKFLVAHGYRDDAPANVSGATCDGVSHQAICAVGASWGLLCEQSDSFDVLDGWLADGPVIAHVRAPAGAPTGSCKFTDHGHYVVVTNRTASDAYAISDPNSCDPRRAHGTKRELSEECALVGFVRLWRRPARTVEGAHGMERLPTEAHGAERPHLADRTVEAAQRSTEALTILPTVTVTDGATSHGSRHHTIAAASGVGAASGAPSLHTHAQPSTANCSVTWHTQPLDHFSFTETRTFRQRVFTFDMHWRRPGAAAGAGPILFYCGNEASVELYVNATGWMWERAQELGALLVWAEHRYYGESLPLGAASADNASTLAWLSLEQALADYATLVHSIKATRGTPDAKVVAIGGSYGGMLASAHLSPFHAISHRLPSFARQLMHVPPCGRCAWQAAWLRMHYPSAVDAALAASAPVLAFDGLRPAGGPFDGNAFWRVVTRDASPAAGAHPHCVPSVRAAYAAIDEYAATVAGRAMLADIFRLCSPMVREGQGPEGSMGARLKAMLLNVFDTLAMGNFPYQSNYLVFQQTRDPTVLLPAWPMRAACNHFADANRSDAPGLLRRMATAAGVLYNASGRAKCYALPQSDLDGDDGIWDWQFCTQRLPQETYFNLTGVTDMFWSYNKSAPLVAAHCDARFPGVVQRPGWIAATSAFASGTSASNIIFSNGEYDPWRSGGVLRNLSSTLVAIEVPQGAHHLDLFFSNPDDPPPVVQARRTELALLKEWLGVGSAPPAPPTPPPTLESGVGM